MLIVIQFPLADARAFAAQETAQILISRFLTLAWENFIRGYGPIRERWRGGVADWSGEQQFAGAQGALRFPDSLRSEWKGEKWGSPEWTVAFRRLLSNGEALSRVEVGLVPRSTKWMNDHSVEDLIDAVTAIPVRVRLAEGAYGQPVHLIRAGQALRDAYVASTTRSGGPIDNRVIAGAPVIVAEAKPHEPAIQARGTRVIQLEDKGIDLWSWRYRTERGPLSVWLVRPEDGAELDAIRNLRIHLLRLHAEREGLRGILNLISRPEFPIERGNPASEALQAYLSSQAQLHGREQRSGLPQSTLLEIAYSTQDLVEPGRRQDLITQLERVRPTVKRRVEVLTAEKATVEPQPKVKVALLAANPVDQRQIRTSAEVASIERVMRATSYRDRFEFKPFVAANYDDLRSLLLDYKPTVVHFAGHGSEAGELLFEDLDGASQRVPADLLSDLFRVADTSVDYVVFNACFSNIEAEAVRPHVKCVICTTREIGDLEAKSFAEILYRSWGSTPAVHTAFELGVNELMRLGTGQEGIPLLLTGPDLDSADLVLYQVD